MSTKQLPFEHFDLSSLSLKLAANNSKKKKISDWKYKARRFSPGDVRFSREFL